MVVAKDKVKPDSDEQVLALRKQLRAPQGPSEAEWLDDACIRRYLRARKGQLAAAAAALEATLQFRKDMQLEALSSSSWEEELRPGRLYISGTSVEGHSVMVTRKRADRIASSERDRYVKFFVWSLEVATKCMRAGREQWVWILDLEGYSSANSPPISVSRQTMTTLAHHYPERLLKAYIVNAPTIFWVLWNALWPFLDPVTKHKVHFVYTKDYTDDGSLRSGGRDSTDFDRYWSYYKEPYNLQKYKSFLLQRGL